MKSFRKFFVSLGLSLAVAALVSLISLPRPARAADIVYTELPQSGENELELQHKVMLAASSNKYSNLASAATTTVKSGSGILEKIVVNTGVASTTVTVYDNTAASGTKIATASTTAQGVLIYGCRFGTGLTVVTSGAADITIVYR